MGVDDERSGAGAVAEPSARECRCPTEPRPIPTISTDNRLLDETIARSFADLALLRNDGPSPGEHYLAAGIPWFATLFGRDSIIAAIETVPFMPANAIDTLDVLARRQATRRRPVDGRRAGQDPPRAAQRRDGASR